MKEKNQKKYIPDDSKARKRAEELVRSLLDESLSTELHDQLRGWFSGAEQGSIIEQIMADVAQRGATPNDKPDKEEYYSLAEVKRRLGMEEDASVVVPLKRKMPAWRIGLRVAAVMIPFIAVLGTGYFAGWFGGDKPQPGVPSGPVVAVVEPVITVETVEGVQKETVLADNTVVWVNSGSKVTYPEEFTAEERFVELEGEAYFDVSRDEGKPFVVQTKSLEVRVLGTTFNVAEKSELGITEVTLHTGLVEVVAGPQSRMLDPMQRLTYHHATQEMTVIAFGNTGESKTDDWRRETIYAGDRNLADLFRMIGNYYDVEIVFDQTYFTGGELYDSAFGRGQTAEEVIGSLSIISGNFTYSTEDGRIIISRN